MRTYLVELNIKELYFLEENLADRLKEPFIEEDVFYDEPADKFLIKLLRKINEALETKN